MVDYGLLAKDNFHGGVLFRILVALIQIRVLWWDCVRRRGRVVRVGAYIPSLVIGIRIPGEISHCKGRFWGDCAGAETFFFREDVGQVLKVCNTPSIMWCEAECWGFFFSALPSVSPCLFFYTYPNPADSSPSQLPSKASPATGWLQNAS